MVKRLLQARPSHHFRGMQAVSVPIRKIGDFEQVQMASGGGRLKIIVLFTQLIQVDNA
jgi:hypothetical protein